jgi:hypothetical protein
MSAIDEILAELRAVPMREQAPEEPRSASPEGCCTGDRRGYQWHQRTGNLPACQASHEANRSYNREYLRTWRTKNPNYRRNWLAQQKNGGAAR